MTFVSEISQNKGKTKQNDGKHSTYAKSTKKSLDRRLFIVTVFVPFGSFVLLVVLSFSLLFGSCFSGETGLLALVFVEAFGDDITGLMKFFRKVT